MKKTNVFSPLSSPILFDTESNATRQYLQAMERLLLVVQDLSLARNLDRIMEIVRVAARELTASDGASFVLRDNGFCYYADENAIAPLWKGQRFPMDICIGGWVMLNHQPAIIEDVSVDERVPYVAYQPTFVKSMVMVPIRTQEPIGAIGTYWATFHQPTLEEIKVLQALADITSIAIENVEVYSQLEQRVKDRTIALEQEIEERKAAQAEVLHLSLTDELTGLYNRRGFFVLGEQQLKLAQRTQIPTCLMFIDLDGLKQINDQLGHEFGDFAILAFANLINQTFRSSDTLGRLGGDEFVLLLQNNDLNVEVMIQRLQSSIDKYNQSGDKPFVLSMSVGVVDYNPNEPVPLSHLITLADELMYKHKRAKKKGCITT
ncbi:sensor domain-containing diguanylate cyclase [Anabaena cylindrica FACHB-243]|uniref:Diguanylate cyclase with GAF sensor n=1 Tax=Anabaena cylindrica (strain ATCC 27899 / PCC 7122) TaxID=272123 RepID=K9ZIS9_ANACC|nr:MULTISPECIES: sensor domain-containing diguanylate cyclase [Anabaena]AFZ58225.1 diguanylate cyclase with GAF sensor [Anabaena cylindrica PCC 7122]MBD2419873.1 sensor domain-containing diguanylate cyclase [Anabaena cylindrica FACHB-243]MBY5280999.1 sensor domain-containing diguanylate cyclase [Anabaena sp. CCAP 1446/1C]MBY5307350.1 sensor domain-containing diguanylate cyclase [Anabaena sp. CCAP 1446/1C]MCM2407928.1 sensor domain-containing diguanylate cyclase [Anabaena sp. CCAP 1446/1C]